MDEGMLSSILALQSTPVPGADQSPWCSKAFQAEGQLRAKNARVPYQNAGWRGVAIVTRDRVVWRVNGWTRATALVLLLSAIATSFAQAPAWKPDKNIEL